METDGLHQNEFLRSNRSNTLFRGSIATASLEAAGVNAKYVNSNPLNRISRDFQPVYDLMKKFQLEAHVNQPDEMPLEVIHDGRPAGSKSYIAGAPDR